MAAAIFFVRRACARSRRWKSSAVVGTLPLCEGKGVSAKRGLKEALATVTR